MLASPADEILRLARMGIGTLLCPPALTLAHLAFCAADILALAAADNLRRPRFVRFPDNSLRASTAPSNPSNSASTRALSFVKSRNMPRSFMVNLRQGL